MIVRNIDKALDIIGGWRSKISWTNGCFDMFHAGHALSLNYISISRPDSKLIVGINSDDSIRRIKGHDRPIIDEDNRAIIVDHIKNVDLVIIFDDDTPYNVVSKIKPDYIFKGEEYNGKYVCGSEFGEVVFIPLFNKSELSTTSIINRIRGLHGPE
jgi:D-beta-D-heptose 7-phosphate kinase/D-beta-D-heptose 1-phosphate adenosyltransferase